MRVIAGSHRGRRLTAPEGITLRPTSDKVREALFSILGARVPGSRFLDLYAGTGAIGIEALSRGAGMVTFVESAPKALRLLQQNLSAFQLLDRAVIRAGLTESFLTRPQWWNGPYDLIFADPPYSAQEALNVVLRGLKPELLSPKALVILEQHSRAEIPQATPHTGLIRRYVYGDTALLVYSRPMEHTAPL